MNAQMPKGLKGAPTIEELSRLVRDIKLDIMDEHIEEKGDTPSIQLTIGTDEDGWSYQTGEDSYAGGAYEDASWGLGYVTRRCNSREVAKDILSDLASQVY